MFEGVTTMLLEDVLEEFIFDCKLRRLSEKTIKGYRNNNLRFFTFIKKEYDIDDLGKIQGNVINAYIAYLTSIGRKPSYINGIIKSFRAFYKYCENEKYVSRNPMNKVNFQKQGKTLIKTFNDKEVRDMVRYYGSVRYLDIRDKLIMVMLLDTGIRNSELCGLLISDIRYDHILIRGKGNKERVVPISPILNKILIKYKRVRNLYIKDKFAYQIEYLFLSQKGKKLTPETVERVVLECAEACKVRKTIRCSPHTCRHYFAQAQLKNGCDLYTLSRLLGHSNINITKIYLQSMDDERVLDMGVKTSPLMNL